MTEHTHEQGNAGGGGSGKWVFWAFVLIAGFFLVAEHRAHAIEWLPYLLLLACPVLHLFHGHGGHEGHGGRGEQGNREERKTP